jgi:hypothetical protein
MLPELLHLAGNRSKVHGKQRRELFFPEEKDIMGALSPAAAEAPEI